MLWNYDYFCPNCGHKLTSENKIHFEVETKDQKRSKLSLSAEPGVYGYESDDNLIIEQGDTVSFYCDSCGTNLQSKTRPQFVEIQLKVTEDIVFEVFFSPVYGEQVTYVEMEDGLTKYTNDFFQGTN